MDRTKDNAGRIAYLPEYLCKRPVRAALIVSVEERDYGNEIHLGLRLPDTSRTFVAKTPAWAHENQPRVGDYYLAQQGAEHLDSTLPAFLFDQLYGADAPSAASPRMRAQFEAWALRNGFRIERRNDPASPDTYFRHETEQRWITWQAASRPDLWEELVRFCPDCGHVGEVPRSARDCCPDGSHARRIPKKLAEQCRATFLLALRGVEKAPVAEDGSYCVALHSDGTMTDLKALYSTGMALSEIEALPSMRAASSPLALLGTNRGHLHRCPAAWTEGATCTCEKPA